MKTTNCAYLDIASSTLLNELRSLKEMETISTLKIHILKMTYKNKCPENQPSIYPPQLNGITLLEYTVCNGSSNQSKQHHSLGVCGLKLDVQLPKQFKSITSFESRLVERHHSLGVCSSHSVNQMVERHYSPGVCHSQSNRCSLELRHSLRVRCSRSASSEHYHCKKYVKRIFVSQVQQCS